MPLPPMKPAVVPRVVALCATAPWAGLAPAPCLMSARSCAVQACAYVCGGHATSKHCHHCFITCRSSCATVDPLRVPCVRTRPPLARACSGNGTTRKLLGSCVDPGQLVLVQARCMRDGGRGGLAIGRATGFTDKQQFRSALRHGLPRRPGLWQARCLSFMQRCTVQVTN